MEKIIIGVGVLTGFAFAMYKLMEKTAEYTITEEPTCDNCDYTECPVRV